MFVIWPVVISMTLGILCGSWIPLFHFVIVAVVETFGSALVAWLSGHDMFVVILDLVAVGVALQFGYVFGILGSFAVSRVRSKTEVTMVKYEPKHDTSLS
ncbi:hypothetical protein LMIY3S_02502 [Labrys miyagiensis]